MKPKKFTYPFCYIPDEAIVEASKKLIERIDASSCLRDVFSEGKMLGVLMVELEDGKQDFLYAYSGNMRISADAGFVPPILDLTDTHGYYKQKEAEISELNARIKALRNTSDKDEAIVELEKLRKEMSVNLQDWLFENYIVFNALGESLSIKEVFAKRGLVPPGGTGDCAAPRLLNYAYRNRMKPLAMGEFWYGASPTSEIRRQGCFYPSCTGKCGPLLGYMLQGLDVEDNPLEDKSIEDQEPEILFEDDFIIVADKAPGMLCVPGKTGTKSLLELLQKRAGKRYKVYSCHRLDMDTSGLVVFAKSVEVQANIEQQFERREVSKSYLARLVAAGCDGKSELAPEGLIDLPMAADYYDRPRQRVDRENGREAITEYRVISINDMGEADVVFTPMTGRTHQLRVHAAHQDGLGRPIKGDRLYGGILVKSERLHLHSSFLEFTHPHSGNRISFNSELIW